jgi:prepilin-type N-terminal cleavage/methylation domain-containing protein/prepilin-type processing-associated H-X9-DG protein
MIRRGFTLIELIVVISVVAMLSALALSAMHGARAQTRSTVCQTHLRELLLAFGHYYNAEDGLLPWGLAVGRLPAPSGGYAGDSRSDLPGWWWFDCVEAVSGISLRDSGILQCPSKRLDDPDLAQNLLCGNYGVNRSLCRSKNDMPPYGKVFGEPYLSINDVRHPGSTLLIVDSGYALVCWWNAADEMPVASGPATMNMNTAYIPGLRINKNRLLWRGQTEDAISGRHPGKTVNIGFADGHVEREKADDLLVTRVDDETYANRSPLWEPK